jgi:tetratricopeptide (TPR) repeat protein
MRVRAGLLLGLGLLIALGWAQATLPKDLQQRFERATRLAAQGKLREAEPLFREIVQKQPNFAPAHLSLGLVYRLLNQNDKALTHLRRAATLNPKDPKPLVELARLCLDINRLDDAQGYIRMLRDRFPSEPELPILEGALASLRGEWGVALQKFQQALKTRPNDFRIHYNLGIAAYQLQRYDVAERHFKRTTELKPDYTTGWKSLGMTYEARGLPEHAIRAYSEALKREPDDLPTRLKRAYLYQRGENLDAALADFQYLAKRYPRNPDAHIGAGLLLMRKERYSGSPRASWRGAATALAQRAALSGDSDRNRALQLEPEAVRQGARAVRPSAETDAQARARLRGAVSKCSSRRSRRPKSCRSCATGRPTCPTTRARCCTSPASTSATATRAPQKRNTSNSYRSSRSRPSLCASTRSFWRVRGAKTKPPRSTISC